MRREWHSKQTENKPASWTEDDVNSIRQTEEREKPITLYSNCDVGDSEGSKYILIVPPKLININNILEDIETLLLKH